MRTRDIITLSALTLVLVAAVAWAEDTEEKAGPLSIGDTLPDFTATDTDGKTFQLSKLRVERADAEASVRATAKAFGAAGDKIDLSTKIADLPGVQDEDGELDTTLKRNFVAKAGAFYGLQASETSVEPLETLEQVVAWIASCNDAPVLFMCWSPNCPTSRKLNDPINEKLAASGVRMFAIASNYRDTDEHYEQFRERFDFFARVIPDRDQEITDVLGGKRTPHFMLIDAKNVLRFRGSLDNDPADVMEEDEKEDWLLDAVAAVRAGTEVPKAETPGPG